MSVRKLRAELKDLRSKVEQHKRPVFVLVEIGETEEQALKRVGIDPDDPTVEMSFVDVYPEELGL